MILIIYGYSMSIPYYNVWRQFDAARFFLLLFVLHKGILLSLNNIKYAKYNVIDALSLY